MWPLKHDLYKNGIFLRIYTCHTGSNTKFPSLLSQILDLSGVCFHPFLSSVSMFFPVLFHIALSVSVQQQCHVSSRLCDACKGSLAIFHKTKALCLVSRLLSLPTQPICAEQGHYCDTNNHLPGKYSTNLNPLLSRYGYSHSEIMLSCLSTGAKELNFTVVAIFTIHSFLSMLFCVDVNHLHVCQI